MNTVLGNYQQTVNNLKYGLDKSPLATSNYILNFIFFAFVMTSGMLKLSNFSIMGISGEIKESH